MSLADYDIGPIVAVRWNPEMAEAFEDVDHTFCRQMMWADENGYAQPYDPPHCVDWHCHLCGSSTNAFGHHRCGWDCVDCRVSTFAIDEYYMVKKELWNLYGVPKGMLCVGCLEDRMGRTLVPEDFTDYPINKEPRDSERLNDRLGLS